MTRSSNPNMFLSTITQWQHDIACQRTDPCNVQDLNGRPVWDCELELKLIY